MIRLLWSSALSLTFSKVDLFMVCFATPLMKLQAINSLEWPNKAIPEKYIQVMQKRESPIFLFNQRSQLVYVAKKYG